MHGQILTNKAVFYGFAAALLLIIQKIVGESIYAFIYFSVPIQFIIIKKISEEL